MADHRAISSCNNFCGSPTPVAVVETRVSPVDGAWLEVAVAVVFRHSRGGAIEFLASRRHLGAVQGGLWEFPGGKIERGESAVDAALRELAEEVGLTAKAVIAPPTPLIVVTHVEDSHCPERAVRLHAFLVEVNADAVARPIGAAEVGWMSSAQLRELAWPRANAAINAALFDWLARVSCEITTNGDHGRSCNAAH